MAIKVILMVVAILVLLVVMGRMFSRRDEADLTRRRLLPNPGDPPTLDHVRRLAEAGEKIQAIKLYRELHNVGLKEAKEAVEKLTS